MSDRRVEETIVYPGNQSPYGIIDGRSFSWLFGSSPQTPWLPYGTGDPARYIQANTGQDYWFDVYFNFLNIQTFMRWFDGHVIGGFPEWYCAGATSLWALDVQPNGLDHGTDRNNNVRNHSGPFIEFSAHGGGTWNSATQCFTNIRENYRQFDIDINRWYYLRGHVLFNTAGGGYLTTWIDGLPWFDLQNIPLLYPGVPGLVGGQAGMSLIEGLYEPAGVTSNQRDGALKHTMSRWGTNLSNMLADEPTVHQGDHSIVVPGVGTNQSLSFDTGTTIPDTYGGPSVLAPVNTVAPVIIASPATVAGLLSVIDGTWTGTTPLTPTYRWFRSSDNGLTDSVIGGATSSTYHPVSADLGCRIRVEVKETNAAGSSTALSAYTTIITAQGTPQPIVIGKQTPGPNPGQFFLQDGKRGDAYFLPQSARLKRMFARLDGLNGATGSGFARMGLVQADGSGEPGTLLAVSSDITIPAGTQPKDFLFTPTTTPVCPSGSYYPVLQIGGNGCVRGYLEQGVGLLRYANDVFSDGMDVITATWITTNGVITAWAEFDAVAVAMDARSSQYQGIDGGIVTYAELNALASDVARAALIDSRNPSNLHTVHQSAVSDYHFHRRVPSAPPPATGWWN